MLRLHEHAIPAILSVLDDKSQNLNLLARHCPQTFTSQRFTLMEGGMSSKSSSFDGSVRLLYDMEYFRALHCKKF